MTINALMAKLLAKYEAEGDLDPLTMRFTFAGLWEDLVEETGEELPEAVQAALDRAFGLRGGGTLPEEPLPVPVRGSFMDHARQFPERDVADWLPA